MRTISFPAQGDYPECSLALPYSRNAAEFTIFHTPLGWRYATGTGNVLTGIAGEEKVLEIALWGAAGSRVGWAAVTDVVISDAPDEIVLQDARDSKKAELAARRYEIEVAGVSAGGQMIATDDRSKAMITGAALGALANSCPCIAERNPASCGGNPRDCRLEGGRWIFHPAHCRCARCRRRGPGARAAAFLQGKGPGGLP